MQRIYISVFSNIVEIKIEYHQNEIIVFWGAECAYLIYLEHVDPLYLDMFQFEMIVSQYLDQNQAEFELSHLFSLLLKPPKIETKQNRLYISIKIYLLYGIVMYFFSRWSKLFKIKQGDFVRLKNSYPCIQFFEIWRGRNQSSLESCFQWKLFTIDDNNFKIALMVIINALLTSLVLDPVSFKHLQG